MKVSLLRLVCIGLFLFAVTSVRVEAKPYEFTASGIGNYTWQSKTDSCADVLFTLVSELNQANPSFGLVGEFVSQSCTTNPINVGTDLIVSGRTSGTIAIDVSTKTDLAFAPGTVNDYTVQDILVLGFAFLAMCFGWGVGARVA